VPSFVLRALSPFSEIRYNFYFKFIVKRRRKEKYVESKKVNKDKKFLKSRSDVLLFCLLSQVVFSFDKHVLLYHANTFLLFHWRVKKKIIHNQIFRQVVFFLRFNRFFTLIWIFLPLSVISKFALTIFAAPFQVRRNKMLVQETQPQNNYCNECAGVRTCMHTYAFIN
jgi:hypothetical protein